MSKEIGVAESDFDEILVKINELAAKTNVNQIDGIRTEKADSELYSTRAQEAASALSQLTQSLTKTADTFNDEKDKSTQALAAFDSLQDDLGEYELRAVYSQANTTAIQESVKSVEAAIEELRRSVQLDAAGKVSRKPSNQAKQESLRSKVKESGVTLGRTKKVRR